MQSKTYYVYIMASKRNGTLYIVSGTLTQATLNRRNIKFEKKSV